MSAVAISVQVNRIGARVFIQKGLYRLSNTITLNGTFEIIGAGTNPSYASATFLVDAGVTTFATIGSSFGTILKGIAIIAEGKTPAPNTPGQLNNDPGNPAMTAGPGSFGLTMINAADALM